MEKARRSTLPDREPFLTDNASPWTLQPIAVERGFRMGSSRYTPARKRLVSLRDDDTSLAHRKISNYKVTAQTNLNNKRAKGTESRNGTGVQKTGLRCGGRGKSEISPALLKCHVIYRLYKRTTCHTIPILPKFISFWQLPRRSKIADIHSGY